MQLRSLQAILTTDGMILLFWCDFEFPDQMKVLILSIIDSYKWYGYIHSITYSHHCILSQAVSLIHQFSIVITYCV